MTTTRLRGRGSYWDAQSRHFEALRWLYSNRTHPTATPNASASRALPRWVLLVDDDSYVNVPALLRLASRFDYTEPLLVGHVLDGVWPSVRGFSGGAAILLPSRTLQP